MNNFWKGYSFWRDLFFQGIKFGLVGILNNIISLGIYYLVIFWDQGLYLFGNIFGFLVSTFSSYLLNSRFVFQVKESKKLEQRSLVKTYVTYLCSLGISTLLIYFFVDIWKLSPQKAPLFSLVVTVPFNFLMSRFWVYSHKKHRKHKEKTM